MNAESLSKIIITWSCEEEDAAGHFLSLHDRQRAEQLAREGLKVAEAPAASSFPEERFVCDRAERLSATLESRHAVFGLARDVTQRQLPFVLVGVLAMLGGVLSDPIGPEGHINLLHFPLLALLLWNMGLYAWLGIQWVVSRVGPHARAEGGVHWMAKAGLAISQLNLRVIQRKHPEETQWTMAVLRKFFRLWSSLVGQSVRLQGVSLLHGAAAVLAVGVVLGMYLRGFVFEYRATWESTFLETEQVHGILSSILFPASLILGVDMPSVQLLAALRAPGNANAAVWIHLWAVTCLLVIVMPRIVLALIAKHKAKKQLESLALPLDEPYFQRMLAPYRGNGIWVEVLPYQCRLDHAFAERLEGWCLQLFGNNSSIQTRPALPYGEVEYRLDVAHGIPLRALIVFDITTTPEQEVHGAFLQHIQAHVQDWPAGGSLLSVVLTGTYQQGIVKQRQQERMESWQRFMNIYGIIPLFVTFTMDNDDFLKQATEALWPVHAQEAL
ncbi:MAG: hypothetical protein NPIRA02_17940 [Nitrospirales bacterium]|nr:MAG: hypothetical protein NPIRA02_17940 [Nitrospirales bacterium]